MILKLKQKHNCLTGNSMDLVLLLVNLSSKRVIYHTLKLVFHPPETEKKRTIFKKK